MACVQDSAGSMGGKKHVMVNYEHENKIECGKLYSANEVSFYKNLQLIKDYDKNIKLLSKYVPKFYDIIFTKNGHKYFVIENLMKHSKKFMDIKIGRKTTYSKDIIKRLRHASIDKYFSISSRYGFRLEGASFPVKSIKSITRKIPTLSRKKSLKYKKYTIKPEDIFDSFFNGSSRTRHAKKVDILIKFAEQNLVNDVFVGGLAGTSLFFTDKGVHLIDFDHAKLMLTEKSATSSSTSTSHGQNRGLKAKNLEEAENFLEGLKSIRKYLS